MNQANLFGPKPGDRVRVISHADTRIVGKTGRVMSLSLQQGEPGATVASDSKQGREMWFQLAQLQVLEAPPPAPLEDWGAPPPTEPSKGEHCPPPPPDDWGELPPMLQELIDRYASNTLDGWLEEEQRGNSTRYRVRHREKGRVVGRTVAADELDTIRQQIKAGRIVEHARALLKLLQPNE